MSICVLTYDGIFMLKIIMNNILNCIFNHLMRKSLRLLAAQFSILAGFFGFLFLFFSGTGN